MKLQWVRPELLRYSDTSPCMRRLDRIVWAEGTCLESYGVRIGIRASQAGVMDQLTPFLPPQWEPIKPLGRLDALYSWVVGGVRRPNVRGFDVIYQGIGQLARTLTHDQLFEAFKTNLRMTVALLSPRFVFVHAGVVGWRGYAIVMPGATFTGKSALVNALTRAGAQYFSDEYAVLDRSGNVHPFAIPISLRLSAADTQEPRPLRSIGTRTDCAIKVGAILATSHRKGAKSRFRRLSPGQGALELVANAVAARRAPSRVLHATHHASKSAIVLRGFRGEAEEAAERLFEILDGWQHA
jgi:hypothetical protein